MRLFIAVDVGERIATETARIIDQLRRRAHTLAPQGRVTWVAPGNIHITIRFIGYAGDQDAERIRLALGEPIPVAPFELTIAGAGAFPPRGTPRVLWAGITRGQDGLAAVEQEVSARLERLGIAPEERAYSPHLTLARVKEPGGLRTAAMLEGLANHEFGTTRIDAITLFESRLSSRGPTYVPLLTTPLT